jgi:hypothetical protein
VPDAAPLHCEHHVYHIKPLSRSPLQVRPRIKGRFATREEVAAMKAAAAAGAPCPFQ